MGKFPSGRADSLKELPALPLALFRRRDVPGEAGRRSSAAVSRGGRQKYLCSAAFISADTTCSAYAL